MTSSKKKENGDMRDDGLGTPRHGVKSFSGNFARRMKHCLCRYTLATSTLVMLRYVEIIEVSFRYRYIESYRIVRLNIDFFDISSSPSFVLEGRLYIVSQ